MRRIGLILLIALGVAVVAVAVLLWLTPPPPVVERPPAPVKEKPKSALQADAEGYYVPGYSFTVERLRFTGLTLRPEPFVTLETSGGSKQEMGCDQAVIRAETVHLRCDYSQVGTVTIDGRFLTRLVTTRLDAPVLSAFVTVRSTSSEILYRARDSFVWHPVE